MLGISNTKNISNGKLEHVFYGTVRGDKINGYHCYTSFGDENVYAEARCYPKSRRIITGNRNKKIAEAYVRDKDKKRLKTENLGKSTLFCSDWSRQDVVDCIDRLNCKGHHVVMHKQKEKDKTKKNIDVVVDPSTGMVFVNRPRTTYPILRL